MNNRTLLPGLLFRHFYGKHKRRDWIRIGIGLAVLACFEIVLLRQAGIDRRILDQPYITGSLILMNVYLTLLFVLAQWREPFMSLAVMLPVSSRSFWIAEIGFILVDTCLRRTLFFLLLPLYLGITGELTAIETLYWIGAFLFLTLYSVTVGILAGNLIQAKRLASVAIHLCASVLALLLILLAPPAGAVWCAAHGLWIIVKAYPALLRPIPVHNRSRRTTAKLGGYSFLQREWRRFRVSKPMVLNYAVTILFVGFFCHNLLETRMFTLAAALPAAAFLLLFSSPAAMLYSLDKTDRVLLQSLPVPPARLFMQKYVFYAGLMSIGFLIITVGLYVLNAEPLPAAETLFSWELLIAGCAVRLKNDERRPILNWTTAQKLWTNPAKYRSWAYCLPLLLPLLLPFPLSCAGIVPVFGAVYYAICKQP